MRDAGPALAAAAFLFYLGSMSPDLPAYRDAGEMATAAATLGVAHPPSYPLYVLTGRAAQPVPVGTPAYRLNLVSALAGGGAAWALYAALVPSVGTLAAALGAAWFAGQAIFRSVATVCEMYTLTLLFAALLLGLARRLREGYDPRLWRGACFAFGLFLGNRTDLLLWAPGLLVAALADGRWREREASLPRWLAGSAAFAALGLSVYLYLPLRSAAGPWLDWNHPADWGNLWGSLTRRGYGGTLDLLSKNYEPGAMFLENLKAYGGHLWRDFLGPAAVLCAPGLVRQVRRDPLWASALALAWVASGPLFLYLANLPPNPHALAILDPHYLLSDLVLAVWAAEGAAWALERVAAVRPSPAAAWAAAGALAVLPCLGGRPTQRADRRWNLTAYDFTRDVLRSVPRGAALIVKEDVQLFGLWYAQEVLGLRPDVRVAAQGLSSSPWYQRSWRRWGKPLHAGPLRTAEDWRRFEALNGPAFALADAEVPSGMVLGPPRGLAASLSTGTARGLESHWALLTCRGVFDYERMPDFFSADLVEEYALSRQRLGAALSAEGRFADALGHLRAGWAMKWLLPDAPLHLGYALLKLGSREDSERAYLAAVLLFDKTLEAAALYHSLPGLAAAVREGASGAWLNLGVVREGRGDKAGAEAAYRRAAELCPTCAQPRYNLAVVLWGSDWEKVVLELEACLRLDARHPDAPRFLAQARERLAQERRLKR